MLEGVDYIYIQEKKIRESVRLNLMQNYVVSAGPGQILN